MNKIGIIGLGNLLLGDEGFGVHIIRHLKKHYVFKNVDIIDGGTIGFQLIGYFIDYDKLLFVDAIKTDDEAGTVYRFNLDALPPNITFVSSIHEIGLGDIIQQVKFMGESVESVAIGVVPLNVCPNELTEHLSDFMLSKVEPVVGFVLKEIEQWGGKYARRGNS